MKLEELLYALPLLVVAIVVVVFNDRQKLAQLKKEKTLVLERGPDESKHEYKTSWKYVTQLLIGSAILIGICVYGSPYWLLIFVAILCAVVALVLLKVFVPIVWVYLKVPFGGKWPLLISRNSSGQMTTVCPKCRKKIIVLTTSLGQQAFECFNCGEKATWN